MRMLVNVQATAGAHARLASALAGLCTPALRWIRHADGLGHAGGHSGALEYVVDDEVDAVVTSAGADLAAIETLIDRERCVVTVGTDVHFVHCPPQPIRYSYFMRRRDDFDHDRYLERYRDVHSRFGVAMPGIEGYTQHHVDIEMSTRAAARLALGIADFDSVSELHLASLDTFFAALATSEIGPEALADEELFVDRANSWDYVYRRL